MNKDIIVDSKYIMHIEGENGEYLEVKNESSFPSYGYILNMDKSMCYDYNGNFIEGSLNYDYETKKVLVNINSSLSCYLFFDRE